MNIKFASMGDVMYIRTCCFTGHRQLPESRLQEIMMSLNHQIEVLIYQEVDTFICGGALGFDMLAAAIVIAKKKLGYRIRLVLALPCRNQEKYWTVKQVAFYRNLLEEADEIIYISEEYSEDCMRKRNRYMVEQSAYCICCLWKPKSGTYQTVNYARKKGIKIINVAG